MLLSLIALTLPLCLDSFLIAATIGISRPSQAHRIRLGIMFAVFEAGMPLVGLLVGSSLSSKLGHEANLVAAFILIGFGLYVALKNEDETETANKLASSHGLAVLAIGFSISLDGLAIGFTYGLLKAPVVLITALIAVQAFVLSQIGFALGGMLPKRLRQYGEKLAGVVLILIGCYLLLAS